MFLWMPRAATGRVMCCWADSTIFSTLFGRDESLERFWKNLPQQVRPRRKRGSMNEAANVMLELMTSRAACCAPADSVRGNVHCVPH